MRILAIDLSWNGDSGWCLHNREEADPIINYGEFKIKTRSGEDYATISYIADQITSTLLSKFRQLKPELAVAEQTDWHQNLVLRSKMSEEAIRSAKSLYKRERIVQRRLGWAEMCFVQACHAAGIDGDFIGAVEAKREYGATGRNQKKVAAELFSHGNLRFRFLQEAAADGPFLHDTATGKKVSSHISDAFVLAEVVAARKWKERLVDHALAHNA